MILLSGAEFEELVLCKGVGTWLLGRAGSGVSWGCDGESDDHVKGRFVDTCVLEQESYSGWCT